MNSDDASDWCPMCGPGAQRTPYGYCMHCGSKLILHSVLSDCERTAWIAALRWVLASPSRIWGSGAGKVCVHGIGAFRPCLICREDVILSKIAELEERKP